MSGDSFDPQSPVEAKEVKEVFVRLGRIMLLQVSGHEIGTTREHPFWVKDRGWVTAGELKEGDLLAGEADGRWLAVERLEDTGRLETVYNLRVQDYHTYFVGSEEWGFSVWAHNASCSAGEAPGRPAGYTRMQDYIPHLDNPATAATTRLTPEQAFALQENLQAIANRTVPAVRTNIQGGRAVADATQGLQGQLNLPRFRFIDQVPGGRAAIDAILREFPNLTFPH